MSQEFPLEPLNDRVVLLPIPASVNETGLKMGLVVAVGEGKIKDDGSRIPLRVKVGDEVVHTSYAGIEINLGGAYVGIHHVILSERDIMAIHHKGQIK